MALLSESTTTRIAGGLDFTAIGGKRQGHEVPQSLRVEPDAKNPVWKTQWVLGLFYSIKSNLTPRNIYPIISSEEKERIGVLESPRDPVTLQKILGAALVIAGAFFSIS